MWDSSGSLYLGHIIFGAFPILCIIELGDAYLTEHFIKQSGKVLPQISGLRIWCPSRKFSDGTNLKSLLYLVLLDWRVK